MNRKMKSRKMQNESEIESEIESQSDHQNENDKIAIKQYLNKLNLDIKTNDAKSKDNVNRLHFIKLKDWKVEKQNFFREEMFFFWVRHAKWLLISNKKDWILNLSTYDYFSQKVFLYHENVFLYHRSVFR
jgi:hypothetical protein